MATGKCREDAKAKVWPSMEVLFPQKVDYGSIEAELAAAKRFLAAL